MVLERVSNAINRGSEPSAASEASGDFTIVSERVAYKRWIQMIDRRVRYPDGREFDYDIASTSFFTLAIAFHSPHCTFTLIREYAQGPNALVYAWAGGKWEPKKTDDVVASAKAELAEEAHLKGGRWVPLLPEGSPGIAEVKWSSNRFAPYLVIDPEDIPDPPERDAEEYIDICRHITVPQLRDIIMAGQMMLPSVQASILAVAHLRKVHGVSIPAEDWL